METPEKNLQQQDGDAQDNVVDERLLLPPDDEVEAQQTQPPNNVARVSLETADSLTQRRFAALGSAEQSDDMEPESEPESEVEVFEEQQSSLQEAAAGTVKKKKGAPESFSDEVKRAHKKEARLLKRKRFYARLKKLLSFGIYGKPMSKVFAHLDIFLNVLMITGLLFFIVFGGWCLVTERYTSACIALLYIVTMKSVASATATQKN